MCDLTHLSSAISPVAITYRCSRPFRWHGNYSRAVMTRDTTLTCIERTSQRTSSESDLMTHIEHFTYLTHLRRELHTYSMHIYIYIYIYIYTYIYTQCIYIYIILHTLNIYIECVCVCVCVYVHRAASRATVQCKHGKHAGHLQKRLLCRLVSKSRHRCSL